MNNLKHGLIVAALLGATALAACASGQTYGKAVSTKASTPIADIAREGKAAAGKHVVVEGKVTAVCPSGCWINVSDSNGTILHIEVAGDFAFPQTIVGKTARAEGNLRYSQAKSKIELAASGVERQVASTGG